MIPSSVNMKYFFKDVFSLLYPINPNFDSHGVTEEPLILNSILYLVLIKIMYHLCQLKVALRLSKLHFQILGTRAGDDDVEGFNGDNRSLINDTDVDKEIIF